VFGGINNVPLAGIGYNLKMRFIPNQSANYSLARIFNAYFCKCDLCKKSKNSKSGFLRNDYL
jgi:hypothetical protein